MELTKEEYLEHLRKQGATEEQITTQARLTEILETQGYAAYLQAQNQAQAKEARAYLSTLKQPIKKKDLDYILFRFAGDNNRWELFTEIAINYRLTKPALNSGLKIAYTTGRADTEEALYYFGISSPRLLMNKAELAVFNSLPEQVTIYRGTSKAEDNNNCSLSWSLSREIAEFFAFRYEQEGRAVYKITVPKASIMAFFNDREEQEIICYPYYLEYEEITDHPTSYYYNYMKKKEAI